MNLKRDVFQRLLDPPFRRRYGSQARRDLGLHTLRGVMRLRQLLCNGDPNQRRFAMYLALGCYGRAARFAARLSQAAEASAGLFRKTSAAQG